MHYKTLLLLAILCRVCPLQSQNLVKNPGFEHHTPVICLGCHAQSEFPAHVSHWHNTGWGAQLFSRKYEFKKSEMERGFYPQNYVPRTGDGVVEVPVRGTTALNARKGGGGSSYIYTKLSKTLVPGNLYRLSMWLKIKSKEAGNSDRFAFLKHFGMELSDKALQTNEASQLLRSYTPFLLDTVIAGAWIPLEYIVRPTRPLSFLTIGWFEHPLRPVFFPNNEPYHWIYFLVDDISVTPLLHPEPRDSIAALDYPVEIKQAVKVPGIPEASAPVALCSIPDSINVYFNRKIDTLDAPSRALLDSFALCLQKDTVAYGLFIRGFADALGTNADNDVLSARRAEAVRQYLVTRHRIPEWQLMASGHGEAIPPTAFAKQHPEHQRRVEIVKSSIRVSDLMYRKLSMYAVKGQSDSAFFWIRAWLKKPEADKMVLLFDPELDGLKSDKGWKAILHQVRQSYQKYAAAAAAFELDSLYFRDQYYRSLPDMLTEIKGYTPTSLAFSLARLRHLDTSLSEQHIPYVSQRLDKQGWPSPELVGERAAMAMALVLIHSRDLPVRKKYLPVVETACKTQKIKPEWYAMLFDKIMMDEKGVQFYATQYAPDKNDPTIYRLAPVESPALVNERRAAIGMYPKDMSFDWFKVIEK